MQDTTTSMPGKRSQKKEEKKKEKARKQHARACKQVASNTTSAMQAGLGYEDTPATMPAMYHCARAGASMQQLVHAAAGDLAGVWGPLQDTSVEAVGLTQEALEKGIAPKTQWDTSDRKDFLHHMQCFALCCMEPDTATLEVVTDHTRGLDGDIVLAGTVRSCFNPLGGEFNCIFQVLTRDPMGEIVFLCNDGANWGRVYLNTFVSRFAQADFKPTEDRQIPWVGEEWKP